MISRCEKCGGVVNYTSSSKRYNYYTCEKCGKMYMEKIKDKGD